MHETGIEPVICWPADNDLKSAGLLALILVSFTVTVSFTRCWQRRLRNLTANISMMILFSKWIVFEFCYRLNVLSRVHLNAPFYHYFPWRYFHAHNIYIYTHNICTMERGNPFPPVHISVIGFAKSLLFQFDFHLLASHSLDIRKEHERL